MSRVLQCFSRNKFTAVIKSRQWKVKAKDVFLAISVLSPYFQFVQKSLYLYAFNLHGEVFLGTEQCSTFLCSFAEALTRIHACEHRIPAVGVQYNLHETCSGAARAGSVQPWAPLEVGANPPVTTFKLLIFTQVEMLIPMCGEQGWVETELRLPIDWVFTTLEIMLCWKPVQHTHWKLKSQGQNITWKLMEWKTSSNKIIFYTSSGHCLFLNMKHWGWGTIFWTQLRVQCIFLWEISFSKGCLL